MSPPLPSALLLCLLAPLGVGVGMATAALARRIVLPDAPLFRLAWPGRRAGAYVRDPAVRAAVAVPAGAVAIAGGAGDAFALTGAGWLLVAIAACDERTLRIPHALSGAGVLCGVCVAALDDGWAGGAARACGTAAMLLGMWVSALVARALAGREALGAGDYGVMAFLGAALGLGHALDALLAGAVVALTWWALPVLGMQGETRAAHRRTRVPFGACLALGTVLTGLAGALPAPVPTAPEGSGRAAAGHQAPSARDR